MSKLFDKDSFIYCCSYIGLMYMFRVYTGAEVGDTSLNNAE